MLPSLKVCFHVTSNCNITVTEYIVPMVTVTSMDRKRVVDPVTTDVHFDGDGHG